MRDTCVESVWEVRRRLTIKHIGVHGVDKGLCNACSFRIWFFEAVNGVLTEYASPAKDLHLFPKRLSECVHPNK